MATKKKYEINPETLAMEQVESGLGYWLRQTGIYILSGIVLGVVFLYLFLIFFPSPREKQLLREKEAMQSQMETLNRQVDQMQIVMTDLQQRDDNLYRVLFGAEPIPLNIRQGTQRKISYYEEIAQMTNSQLSADLSLKVDVLEKELYVQAKSYDEVLELAKTQEIRMENIPAIQPVLNKDLKRVASGYGVRIDPVYHVRKFHQGMDFTAPTGTEVFATGNAKVSFVGMRISSKHWCVKDRKYVVRISLHWWVILVNLQVHTCIMRCVCMVSRLTHATTISMTYHQRSMIR